MRPTIDEVLARAEPIARSPAARDLYDLCRELLDLSKLAAEVRAAQQAFYDLKKKRSVPEAEVQRALAKAKGLEAKLDRALALQGLAGQVALPEVE